MLKPMMNIKMQLMVLLGTLAVALSGCGSKMPKPPQGEFLIHNQKKGVAVCSDIQTAQKCDPKKIEDTDKFVMFSPKTWENLQNYIDALIRAVQAQANEYRELMLAEPDLAPQSVQSNGVFISDSQIRWFRSHIKTVEANAKKQGVKP